jgi:hypothetical protein
MFRCIHYLQCFDDCSPDLWETQRTVDVEKLRIDMTTFKCVLLPNTTKSRICPASQG